MEMRVIKTNKKYDPVKIVEIADRLPKEYRKKFIEMIKKKSQGGKKKIRVLSDGCFDMFHFGHMRQFEQIKQMIPNIELVVGICADKDILENKGTGVMNDDERIEAIRHCRHVDEIIFPTPWSPSIEYMKKYNLDFVAHDTIPYLVPGEEDCYEKFKREGMFLPTLRTEGISTSDLLIRILKDKERYYARNLQKGYSRKELNLNYLEYLNVQMKGVMTKIKTCLRQDQGRTQSKNQISEDDSGEENEE